MANNSQYLTLGLDRELFGIEIAHVREILEMRPIAKLPHAPEFLLGMIDVRGTGYPILDLRAKLGLPTISHTDATRIILLDASIKGRPLQVGFVADRVFEVTYLDEGSNEPAPDVGGQWRSNYINFIGRKGEAFVVVFDLQRLMGADADQLPHVPATEAA